MGIYKNQLIETRYFSLVQAHKSKRAIIHDQTMKFLLAVGAILLLVNAAYSVPLSDFEELEYGDNEGIRQRRVTCDLLSPEISVKGFGGKVNHGACAANCLSMGKAGGRCNNGICQCRKTTFGDLWKQRFG